MATIRCLIRTTTTRVPDQLPSLLRSQENLQHAFARGLEDMLDADVLGAFILVLANACFDTPLFERLRMPLHAAFIRWCARFDVADPLALGAAADDVDVFLRVRELGFDRLSLTRWRVVGPWQLQFNALRALRPPRASAARVDSLQRPFDNAGFHFNKPFLQRETLWQGGLAGTKLRLLYNKFPFAESHGLLVPEPAAGHAQFLTEAHHRLAWRCVEQLGEALPGLGLGYNALGALASVNHLHFQLFVRSAGCYPIESPHWQHNGGTSVYPLPVSRMHDASSAWHLLNQLHAQQQPYNLVYRPGVLFVAPRAWQDSCGHSPWTSGFAWSELAGVITLFEEDAFASLDVHDIEMEFARIAPAFRP